MSAFDEQRETILKEYFELLRFPTIGAEPMRLKDCVDCAMWLKKWLTPQGFSVELMQAPKMLGTPPILLAERKGTEGAPMVLFYGHYDVQPPDPLEAWDTPPFEPTLKDNQRVYCRGAQDDKGQFFSFLCGMRNFLARAPQAVPTIKIVLEGQEESGSTALAALAPTIKDRLRADVLLVCDTSAAADLRPAIVAGLRGVSHFTVRLEAANYDLHSGEHGGIAPNPAQGMAELIASLHNPDGSIAVRGFCDHVVPPTDEERAAAESILTGQSYTALLQATSGWREIRRVRNVRASFHYGVPFGVAAAGLAWITNGTIPWFRVPGLDEGDAAMLKNAKRKRNVSPPSLTPQRSTHNARLSSATMPDRLTDVFMSGTRHEEDQPCHLKIADPAKCEMCRSRFDAPCTRFCPAEVYRMEDGKLEIDFSNCLHCKTCRIKCPMGNIDWTFPQGGDGPRYTRM